MNALPTDAIQDALIEDFALCEDWQERYRYVIELGQKLPPLADVYRVDAYLVRGCQSQVWLRHRRDGDAIHFEAASDAAIVRGLIALLLRLYSGQTPATILATAPRFIDVVGLGEHLSQNRSNGLAAMVARIKQIAQHEMGNAA